MKTVIVLRGLPGSGKTTLARTLTFLVEDSAYVEADSFFIDDVGNYNFDCNLLPQAHKKCKEDFIRFIEDERELIIISNTATREKEFAEYEDIAKINGYAVFSLIVENRHGNKSVHDVN